MKIGDLGIYCSNLDRSVAFYCDRLGFEVITRSPDEATLACDGRRFVLRPVVRDETDGATWPMVVFDVVADDVAAETARLDEAGVESEGTGLVCDPDGLLIRLVGSAENDVGSAPSDADTSAESDGANVPDAIADADSAALEKPAFADDYEPAFEASEFEDAEAAEESEEPAFASEEPVGDGDSEHAVIGDRVTADEVAAVMGEVTAGGDSAAEAKTVRIVPLPSSPAVADFAAVDEARKYERVKVAHELRVESKHGPVEARTVDLSRTGMLVQLPSAGPGRTLAEFAQQVDELFGDAMRLVVPGLQMSFLATIARVDHVDDQWLVGGRFDTPLTRYQCRELGIPT